VLAVSALILHRDHASGADRFAGADAKQHTAAADRRAKPAQSCEPNALLDLWRCGISIALLSYRRFSMLMFKRSQLLVGAALAALAEIIVLVSKH
jgi:hypothetical protein